MVRRRLGARAIGQLAAVHANGWHHADPEPGPSGPMAPLTQEQCHYVRRGKARLWEARLTATRALCGQPTRQNRQASDAERVRSSSDPASANAK